MIFLPALRDLTGPLPPGALAARFFAAVMRPPLLFLAIWSLRLDEWFNSGIVAAAQDQVVDQIRHCSGEHR